MGVDNKRPRTTWGEFKKLLEAKGVTDDMEIRYMDFSGVENPNQLDVEVDSVHKCFRVE